MSYQFSPFQLDVGAAVLFRDGEVVPLRAQCVRLLHYLVERFGRVVPKQELLENVWHGVSTTEGVLKSTMSELRRALGDDAGDERYVRTFHKRGYQFIATVTMEGQVPKPSPVSPLVDDSRLIGRDAATAVLHGAYAATLEGQGAPVLVTADAGGGKTMLVRHFLDWTSARHARVLYARFFDYTGSRLAPFETFADLLRSSLDDCTAADKRAITAALRAYDGSAEDRSSVDGDPATSSSGSLKPNTALDDRFRAVGPVSRALLTLSRSKPTVLALDDVQWATDADRDLLSYLMASRQSEPLMIVAIVRAEDLRDDTAGVATWLRRRGMLRQFTIISLTPWTDAECREAIAAALADTRDRPAEVDAEALHRLTGGNPYFVMEMLRSLVGVGERAAAPTHSARGGSALANALPPTLAVASEEHINRLSEPVRGLVEQAAVLGDEFRAATLAQVADRAVDDVDTLLQEAVRASVLSTQLVSLGEDYRFYHTILRRAVYDGMLPRKRRDLHAKAARSVEIVYADQLDRVADAISGHYEAADDAAATLTWALRAWRIARARWRWPDAATGIDRAIRAARRLDAAGKTLDAETSASLQFGLGERHALQGDLAASSVALSRAAAEAEACDLRPLLATVLLQWSSTLAGLSVYDEAAEAAERARGIWYDLGERDQADQATVQWAAAQLALGNHQRAAPRLAAVLDGRPSAPVSAASALMMGWMHALQGRHAEAERLLERALRGYDRLSDTRSHALTLRRSHWVALARGQYERAFALADGARLEYRRVDDAVGEAKSLMQMGQARIDQGLYREGLELIRSAHERMVPIGDAHCLAETVWLMGRGHSRLDDYVRGRALLEDALTRVRGVGDRDDEFRVLTDLSIAMREQGDLADALNAVDQAVAIARDLGSTDGVGGAQLERALTLLYLEQRPEAEAAATEALDLLETAGSGLRWRSHLALGRILCGRSRTAVERPRASPRPRSGRHASRERQPRSQRDRAISHLERAVALATEIRAQLSPADRERWGIVTQALSGPAQDLESAWRERGDPGQADAVHHRWFADLTNP